jgi:hypothetical protein
MKNMNAPLLFIFPSQPRIEFLNSMRFSAFLEASELNSSRALVLNGQYSKFGAFNRNMQFGYGFKLEHICSTELFSI